MLFPLLFKSFLRNANVREHDVKEMIWSPKLLILVNKIFLTKKMNTASILTPNKMILETE